MTSDTDMVLLRNALVDGDEEKAVATAEAALGNDVPVAEIIQEGMARAGEVIGRRFEDGQAFLPELLMTAEAMKAVMVILRPLIVEGDRSDARRTVVIGTIQGDVHDIGKNLVALMLEGAGYRVVDLGVDVAAERFVQTVADESADVVGMSALLTTTMTHMRTVVGALRERQGKDAPLVIVGGASVDADFAHEIGADLFAQNAARAVVAVDEALERGGRS